MNDWSEYPKWVTALRDFLEGTIIDHIAQDGSEDAITDKVTEAALAVVCGEYGHCVEDDQCGKPEHRYCLICSKRMSNVPLGHYEVDEPAPLGVEVDAKKALGK
jgi:hypothetical protein